MKQQQTTFIVICALAWVFISSFVRFALVFTLQWLPLFDQLIAGLYITAADISAMLGGAMAAYVFVNLVGTNLHRADDGFRAVAAIEILALVLSALMLGLDVAGIEIMIAGGYLTDPVTASAGTQVMWFATESLLPAVLVLAGAWLAAHKQAMQIAARA